MLLIFEHDINWSGVLGYNERTQKVVYRKTPPPDILADEGDALTDEHTTQATVWLQSSYGFGLKGTAIVHAAMIAASKLCRFDPVMEWLDLLPEWDGVPRVDQWLPLATGCDDTLYTRAVGAAFLVGACARVYAPGAKVDTVLVLQGPQGTLKSTLLRTLAVRDEWFTDHISDIGGKDAALQLCGPWILEIAELDGVTGKRENERVKSWITQQWDRFRPPFGRSVVDVPRRVTFVATSNLDQFLRDETGGRRFLPVVIREVNVGIIESSREQIWAEAKERYKAGEQWWLTGEALSAAKDVQEDRRISDPWEDAIRGWLADTEIKMDGRSTHSNRGHRLHTTSGEILCDCLKIDLGKQTKTEQDRVGRVLRTLGWRRTTQRIEGKVKKCWLPPLDGEAVVVGTIPETESAREKEQVGIDY